MMHLTDAPLIYNDGIFAMAPCLTEVCTERRKEYFELMSALGWEEDVHRSFGNKYYPLTMSLEMDQTHVTKDI